MKKIIILGVVFLFFGMGFQPAFAVENRLSTDNGIEESDVELIKQQDTCNFLPDLVIKDINYYLHDPGSPFYYIEADIKNQGFGYLYDGVTVEFRIVSSIFWLINLNILYENNETEYFYGGLAPGETSTVYLYIGEPRIPIFGFLKFEAGINLDKKIEEKNYFNNRRIERVFCFFGWLF
jgi:hypothetical protein